MLSILAFVLMLGIGVPVSFALLGAALLQIALSGNAALLVDAPAQMFAGVESYGLLALPVFLLLGELMAETGAARQVMQLARRLLWRTRGGLAQVVLLASAGLAAVLGSSVAQITVMARIAVPEMVAAGVPAPRAAALVAAGSLMAPVVPPSMLLIVYGVVAQVPVGRLFVAGLLPGLMLLLALGLVARFTTLPAQGERETASEGPPGGLAAALPAIGIPLAMIAAIVSGLATAVEAGIVGVAAALALAPLCGAGLRTQAVWRAVERAALTAAMVLFLVATASLYGWIAAWENLPARAAAFMTSLTDAPLAFLLLFNLGLLLLGMVMDPMPALILVVPVFLPVAVETYGIDPIHFGLVICVNLTLGLLTPPVGTGLYTAARVSGVPPERLMVALAPFLAAGGGVLLLLTLWPGLATGLVTLLF